MENEKLYLEIVENMREGAYFANGDKKIIFWNNAAENISGYTKEDMIGKHCQDTPLQHINCEGNKICVEGCPLHLALMDGESRKHDVFLKHVEGHRVAVSVSTFPVRENGEIVGAVEIFTPSSLVIYDDDLITQLASSATNDHLTGIPNRRMVETFLDLRLKEMALYKYKVCVILLDIDHFRDFNNTYGHDAGDVVLKTVSSSITKMTRNTDLFGRWGGEEFLGIHTIKSDSDTLLLGEKIRASVEGTQIEYEGAMLSVTVSIGITVAKVGDTIESVVKRADDLMYKSKQNGRNCVTIDAT